MSKMPAAVRSKLEEQKFVQRAMRDAGATKDTLRVNLERLGVKPQHVPAIHGEAVEMYNSLVAARTGTRSQEEKQAASLDKLKVKNAFKKLEKDQGPTTPTLKDLLVRLGMKKKDIPAIHGVAALRYNELCAKRATPENSANRRARGLQKLKNKASHARATKHAGVPTKGMVNHLERLGLNVPATHGEAVLIYNQVTKNKAIAA